MARPRKNKHAHLPENLYAMTRQGKTYYKYVDPVTKKSVGFGRDMSAAILEAESRNWKTKDILAQVKSGAYFRSGIPCIRGGNVDGFGLYELGTIVGAARSVDKVCGIYFLISAGKVVYIGQSKDVLTRLASHMRGEEKEFASFSVLEAEPEQLNELEARYIAKYDPIYNKVRPKINMAANV